jgi:hypothetical protein
MIVVVLRGGLGNQMFQYASARALSLRCNTELVLNTKLGFVTDKMFNRVFAMDKFNIHYIKNRILSFDFLFGRLFYKLSLILGRHIIIPWYKVIHEKDINANEFINNSSKYKNCILYGYYISQDFFKDQIEQLRKDFSLHEKNMPVEVSRYLYRMERSDKILIAIGVRIYQDVKDNKIRESRFFVEKGDYYARAMNYYLNKYKNVKFLIFTQGKEWVLENIPLSDIDYEFIETGGNDYTAVYDMMILSRCNHYILSNSTFYWWGAWLNPCVNKEIII